LNFVELSTTLIEIEAVLNSRPLTYVYDEMEEPLTPSHLIIGRRILSMPSRSTSNEVGRNEVTLTRRAKFLQRILDHFWNRWRSKYLTELRDHHRHSKRANLLREVQVGDIVCLHEHKIPGQLRRLGKVEGLLRGRNGHVRSAAVRVKSANSHTSEFRRPSQRLYPLEVNAVPDNPAPHAANIPIKVVRDDDIPNVVVSTS